MKKLKIYLDTSVINFLFADDAPEFKKITIEFFETFVKTGIYEFYISDIVLAEISLTKDHRRKEMLFNKIKEYPIDEISTSSSDDIILLSKLYISNGVFSENSINDALHVATAVINQIDVLLSWNFKHLANIERERKIHAVNLVNNYSTNLRILTPLEVFDYENI